MSASMQDLAARARLLHRAWRYRLRAERAEIAFMLRHLSAGQTAVDIGAHKGAFTYWMDRRVGSEGQVLAFEPIAQLAAYLRHMCKVYPLSHVKVVESALSNRRGDGELFIPEAGGLGTTTLIPQEEGHQVVSVPIHTLDEYCREGSVRPVDFVKCDVEGHELEVFQGAERILREDRPILLFECQNARHDDGQIERVFHYLKRFGYDGCFFPRGKMRPLNEFRTERHQIVWTDKDWCDNFGFIPVGGRHALKAA